MQIKNTIRYYFIPVRIAIIKKSKDVDKNKPLSTISAAIMKNSMKVPQKTKNRATL